MLYEKYRDLLVDIHDEFMTSYPWAFQTESTTIEDFLKAMVEIDDKIMDTLYDNNDVV